MKKYCPVCFRKISTNTKGKIYRHGFKKNRWIFDERPKIGFTKYKQVDSSPCRGSSRIGLSEKQLEK